MSPEIAFLRSIKEAPADNTPRLVFADWLEEHGQPERADLLRIPVELARLPENHPDRAVLKRREVELLAQHGQRWLGPWAGVGQFTWGLVRISCEMEQMARLLD